MPKRDSELIANRDWDVDDAVCPEIDELWVPPGWPRRRAFVSARYFTRHPADGLGFDDPLQTSITSGVIGNPTADAATAAGGGSPMESSSSWMVSPNAVAVAVISFKSSRFGGSGSRIHCM